MRSNAMHGQSGPCLHGSSVRARLLLLELSQAALSSVQLDRQGLCAPAYALQAHACAELVLASAASRVVPGLCHQFSASCR